MIPTMDLGRKFRKFKGQRTYAEIARAVGCSPDNVRRIIDTGTERKLVLGVRLARTLGVDIDWLVDGEADSPPPVDHRSRVLSAVAAALSSAGLAGELSGDEAEIVGIYRGLSEIERVRLAGFLAGLASREPLSPEGAAARIRSAADRVTDARRRDPRRSTGSPPRRKPGSQTGA